MFSGCEVAVCEAQCVVGSVIRPVDPFLPPMYTHCGHTAGPSGQPLQPHHFPSLGGMTEEGRRNGRAAFHWLLPRCGLSVSVHPSVSAVHRGRIEGHSGENREGVFLYPKTNPSPSHATFFGVGAWTSRGTSHVGWAFHLPSGHTPSHGRSADVYPK